MFAVLIAVCAQISVPMVPVPMTMQTFAVLLAGAWMGPWRGLSATLLYLAAAWAGLPVLSDARGGLDALTGPTAGYLVMFPVAAGLAGGMGRSGLASRPVAFIAGLCAIHLLVLAVGTAWLAQSIGYSLAIAAGFTPFLVGALVKSALVWASLAITNRFRRTAPAVG